MQNVNLESTATTNLETLKVVEFHPFDSFRAGSCKIARTGQIEFSEIIRHVRLDGIDGAKSISETNGTR